MLEDRGRRGAALPTFLRLRREEGRGKWGRERKFVRGGGRNFLLRGNKGGRVESPGDGHVAEYGRVVRWKRWEAEEPLRLVGDGLYGHVFPRLFLTTGEPFISGSNSHGNGIMLSAVIN